MMNDKNNVALNAISWAIKVADERIKDCEFWIDFDKGNSEEFVQDLTEAKRHKTHLEAHLLNLNTLRKVTYLRFAGDIETTEDQFNVRALRRAFRMTQQEFADSLGLSIGTIKRYELDRTLKPTPAFRKLLTVIANHPEVMEYFKKTS